MILRYRCTGIVVGGIFRFWRYRGTGTAVAENSEIWYRGCGTAVAETLEDTMMGWAPHVEDTMVLSQGECSEIQGASIRAFLNQLQCHILRKRSGDI